MAPKTVETVVFDIRALVTGLKHCVNEIAKRDGRCCSTRAILLWLGLGCAVLWDDGPDSQNFVKNEDLMSLDTGKTEIQVVS